MNSRDYIEWLRGLDKRWQRNRGGERRQILVDGRTAMNYATVAPIVERLQQDPRIKIFLTASESPHLLDEIYAEARPPHTRVKPKNAALIHFDAYLTADFLWARLPRGTRRVQTFHGVAGKYRTVYDSPAESMRHWDRLFFINKRRLQHFIDSGAIDEGSSAARLIGMPKLDCLVDGTLQRDELLAGMGIDPARKAVLYAPTWSAHSSVVSMGETLVQRL